MNEVLPLETERGRTAYLHVHTDQDVGRISFLTTITQKHTKNGRLGVNGNHGSLPEDCNPLHQTDSRHSIQTIQTISAFTRHNCQRCDVVS